MEKRVIKIYSLLELIGGDEKQILRMIGSKKGWRSKFVGFLSSMSIDEVKNYKELSINNRKDLSLFFNVTPQRISQVKKNNPTLWLFLRNSKLEFGKGKSVLLSNNDANCYEWVMLLGEVQGLKNGDFKKSLIRYLISIEKDTICKKLKSQFLKRGDEEIKFLFNISSPMIYKLERNTESKYWSNILKIIKFKMEKKNVITREL